MAFLLLIFRFPPRPRGTCANRDEYFIPHSLRSKLESSSHSQATGFILLSSWQLHQHSDAGSFFFFLIENTKLTISVCDSVSNKWIKLAGPNFPLLLLSLGCYCSSKNTESLGQRIGNRMVCDRAFSLSKYQRTKFPKERRAWEEEAFSLEGPLGTGPLLRRTQP